MFRPLKDYLNQALRRSGAERSVTAVMIVEAAQPILMQVIPILRSADFKVVSYRHDCLTVAAASPTAGQEIRIRAEAILEVLEDAFPGKSIKRLNIVPLIEQDEEF